MNNNINILITGGTGFIGKSLISKLSNRKVNILAISRKKKKSTNSIKWIYSDLKLNKNALQQIYEFKPDIIFHLAWEKIPDFSKKVCNINLKKNITFFNKILRIKSIKKIIVSGSCFEYFIKRGKKKEINSIDLKNNFPKTKNLIFNFLKQKCNNTQKIAWFRIFYAYGLGQRKNSLIPYLLNSIKRKKTIELKTPNIQNDYIYVDDIVKIFIKSINTKFNTGIYNLGSGKKTKIISIVKMIEKITKTRVKLKNNKQNNNKFSFYADMNKTKKNFKIKSFTKTYTGIKKYFQKYKSLHYL